MLEEPLRRPAARPAVSCARPCRSARPPCRAASRRRLPSRRRRNPRPSRPTRSWNRRRRTAGETCRPRAAAASPAGAPASTSDCRSRRCRSSTRDRAGTACSGWAEAGSQARRMPRSSMLFDLAFGQIGRRRCRRSGAARASRPAFRRATGGCIAASGADRVLGDAPIEHELARLAALQRLLPASRAAPAPRRRARASSARSRSDPSAPRAPRSRRRTADSWQLPGVRRWCASPGRHTMHGPQLADFGMHAEFAQTANGSPAHAARYIRTRRTRTTSNRANRRRRRSIALGRLAGRESADARR